MYRLLTLAAVLTAVGAIDNGKGKTPPMGWRSWNLFGANVDQELIQSQMDGIYSAKRLVNGVPTSLRDLGYKDVGLDDAWQVCGSHGRLRYTYHDETTGVSEVDTTLFPDFKKMTDYAHSLGLTAGWYHNNCICEDHCATDECYTSDANAIIAYGFDSVKLDGCGKQLDLQKWSDLFDAAGKSILIENCHWGNTVPTADWCPWNYYRTSGDVRASYDSVLSNLMTTVQFAKSNLSFPGCWAYPDMLEVGCSHGPGGEDDPGLSFVEARTHFGAWCIVSSPLILSHDTTNDTISDEIWPIISNTEAIAINQAWAGDSGTIFATSSHTVSVKHTPAGELGTTQKPTAAASINVGAWQQWSKKLSDTSAAVLLMNNGDDSQTVSLTFSAVPTFASAASGATYSLRSVWDHADLGQFSGSYTVTLASHDSAFLVVTLV